MDKAELYSVHQKWIEQCQLSGNLTEWEENFVDNVKKQLERRGSLSPAQVEILERIYAEKT